MLISSDDTRPIDPVNAPGLLMPSVQVDVPFGYLRSTLQIVVPDGGDTYPLQPEHSGSLIVVNGAAMTADDALFQIPQLEGWWCEFVIQDMQITSTLTINSDANPVLSPTSAIPIGANGIYTRNRAISGDGFAVRVFRDTLGVLNTLVTSLNLAVPADFTCA